MVSNTEGKLVVSVSDTGDVQQGRLNCMINLVANRRFAEELATQYASYALNTDDIIIAYREVLGLQIMRSVA